MKHKKINITLICLWSAKSYRETDFDWCLS